MTWVARSGAGGALLRSLACRFPRTPGSRSILEVEAPLERPRRDRDGQTWRQPGERRHRHPIEIHPQGGVQRRHGKHTAQHDCAAALRFGIGCYGGRMLACDTIQRAAFSAQVVAASLRRTWILPPRSATAPDLTVHGLAAPWSSAPAA